MSRNPIIVTLIVTMVTVELVLALSDWKIIDPANLRSVAIQWAGFWPGLLYDWQANYDNQPYLMFASYAFLHGGPLHMAFNMITLFSLAGPVVGRVGSRGFLIVYTLSIIGGALGYAALWSTPQPMVGASGALFGLAGAFLAWEYVDRFTARIGLWPVLRLVLMLVALNVVMYYSLDGQLAWQTHLGGFITGWVAALLIDPRSREHQPDTKDDNDAGSA